MHAIFCSFVGLAVILLHACSYFLYKFCKNHSTFLLILFSSLALVVKSDKKKLCAYSFVRNCKEMQDGGKGGGGGGGNLQNFWGKTPQVHLIIVRELPTPPSHFKKS